MLVNRSFEMAPKNDRQKEDKAMKTIGGKIRECRARLDMTQAELSSQTGLTIRTVSKYETDSVTPRGTNLHKLAMALGVSEEYLTNPEIDDPSYGLDEAPYLDAARQKYGKKGADDLKDLLTGVQTMLAGGDVPQDHKDQFFQAVMQAYLECKEEARNKFTPKKYRK